MTRTYNHVARLVSLTGDSLNCFSKIITSLKDIILTAAARSFDVPCCIRKLGISNLDIRVADVVLEEPETFWPNWGKRVIVARLFKK
jgi:hypothetical protein